MRTQPGRGASSFRSVGLNIQTIVHKKVSNVLLLVYADKLLEKCTALSFFTQLTVLQGLEEMQVQGKNEVYTILERGSKKRQTVATLMNAHSSRAHTIFTVTVHMKESNGVDGKEVEH